MSNICSTVIQFYGNETLLTNLFKKLSSEMSLSDLAGEFDIEFSPNERNGFIEYVDFEQHRVWQSDDWLPHMEIWNKIIDRYYVDENGDRLVDFCYMAEEFGCGVYINTDESGEYFPELYRVEFCTKDTCDTIYFESTADLLDWFEEIFEVRTDNVNDLERIAADYINTDEGEYFTLGIFTDEEGL